MLTNRTLRRMTKVELVQYGMQGSREQRRAADELFRRYHRRFQEKGLLDGKLDIEAVDHVDEMLSARTGDLL